jgi:hypothetical protein
MAMTPSCGVSHAMTSLWGRTIRNYCTLKDYICGNIISGI